MSEIKEKSPHAKLDLIEGDMTSFKCALPTCECECVCWLTCCK